MKVKLTTRVVSIILLSVILCECESYEYGDINSDNSLDVIDIVLIVNMILGNSEIDLNASDLNNDGELNVVDVVLLVNLILGN